MLEPELQNYLSGINQSLTEMKNKKQQGIWRSFFNGMFSAVGYFVGLFLVVAIVGFILNKTGKLAVLQQQIKDFQSFMDQARKVIGGDSNNGNQQGSTTIIQNGDTFTLPDGRKVQIVK